MKVNMLEKAVKWLERAIKLSPSFSEGYNNLGLCLQQMNKFPESTIFFEKAIELIPYSFNSFNNLGISLLRMGKK